MAVSLSRGQDVTLSESSSSSGTCNITSCSYHRDSGGARVSCDASTCFEAFNGSGNCFSSDSEFTMSCSPRSEESGSSLSNTTRVEPVYGPSLPYVCFEPYACQVQSSTCLGQGDVCLCRGSNCNHSDNTLLSLLSFGFGLVLIFLPIIIFFNCNLASGPNHSFVFFYQCVPLASVVGSLTAVLVMQNFFLPDQPRFIVLEYCKYIVVLVVIVLVFFLVKCTSCPLQKCRLPWAKVRRAVRNFREKHIGSTFIHAICSIIVLSYGDLVAISMRVALGSVHIKPNCCYVVFDNYSNVFYSHHATSVTCNDSYTVYFDSIFLDVVPNKAPGTSFKSVGNHILQYFIPSVVFLFFLLPLPLSLIYYPSIPALFHKLTGRSLPRFPKLDPVFDVFQGVYKDKMRWFAGVHLLYLMILWVVYLCKPVVILFFFVLILAIHSLFQPFKNPKHNYLETLYLVYLVIMSLGNIYVQILNKSSNSTISSSDEDILFRSFLIIITYSLLFFPAFIVIVRFCYKFPSTRACCQRFAAKIKSCHKAEQVQLKEEQEEEEEPHYYEALWL